MERRRQGIKTAAQIEHLIGRLCAAARPRDRAVYRLALEDFAIVCARYGAADARAKIAAQSAPSASILPARSRVH